MIYCLDLRTATPHFPGIGRYARNLVQALIPELDDDDEELAIITGSEVDASLFTEKERRGKVSIYPSDVNVFSLRQQIAIPRLIARIRPDIYHSLYYLMPYHITVPTILTVYDLIPLHFPATVSLRARLLFRLTYRLALNTAHHTIAISNATRLDFIKYFHIDEQNITTIPLAADPRFIPQSASEIERVRHKYNLPHRFVLYLGINKPHKNLERLVEAWTMFLSSHPQNKIKLVIAGKIDPRYSFHKLEATKIATDTIQFLGEIDDIDLPGLYCAAYAFIHPSLYEGFGLPVLEALACGTPVACSNNSSLPEVAGDAALYFDAQDVSSIVNSLDILLAGDRLYNRLRERTILQAKRFSWESTAKATKDLYKYLATRYVTRR